MGYRCQDCGNENSFLATQPYTKYGYQNVTIDSEGSITDYGDSEENDENTDDLENIECYQCGSSHVRWEDENRRQEEEKVTSWKTNVN